jgi:hypothetical protein
VRLKNKQKIINILNIKKINVNTTPVPIALYVSVLFMCLIICLLAASPLPCSSPLLFKPPGSGFAFGMWIHRMRINSFFTKLLVLLWNRYSPDPKSAVKVAGMLNTGTVSYWIYNILSDSNPHVVGAWFRIQKELRAKMKKKT